MVKINEFHKFDDTLPYNVVDDVAIFMRNDPMFYRKEFYPAIIKIKTLHDKNKTMNPKSLFNGMIEKASNLYCKKYNINKRPNELLTDSEKDSLIQKLYSEEMHNIRNGVY
jgi:hypothetical protein